MTFPSEKTIAIQAAKKMGLLAKGITNLFKYARVINALSLTGFNR